MQCFYEPGSEYVIDTIGENGLSSVYQESPEEIRRRYPRAEIWNFDEAWKEVERIQYETYISAPKEITEERWYDMLDILPPMQWRKGCDTETFLLRETLTLDLHLIFCRIGARYFEMTDRRSLSHEQIVDACKTLL